MCTDLRGNQVSWPYKGVAASHASSFCLPMLPNQRKQMSLLFFSAQIYVAVANRFFLLLTYPLK